MKKMKRVIVTRDYVGLTCMQVCAVEDATDEEILEVCNRENPSGTEAGWSTVLRGEHDGPVRCETYPDRLHWLAQC